MGKMNYKALAGILSLIVLIILGILLYARIIEMRQFMVFVVVIVCAAALGFFVKFIFDQKNKKVVAESLDVKKDDSPYAAKLKDRLFDMGIEPIMEISNRVVGRNNEQIIFCKYKNIWRPYEKGYLLISCLTGRISEFKTEQELKEAILGPISVASKPIMYKRESKTTEGVLGEKHEEYVEVPMEEAEKIEQKKAEAAEKKI